jgi:hypothetical protein
MPVDIVDNRVLGGLIDALPRREPPHEARIAVAARARRDLSRTGRPAGEPAGRVIRSRFLDRVRVAAVAVGAGQPAFAMDVHLGEDGCGRRESRVRLRGVAQHAGVRGGGNGDIALSMAAYFAY